MTGDEARPGVGAERDDAVSRFSQDGADFLTAHDALKGGKRQKARVSRREKIDGVGDTDAGADCVCVCV